MYVVTTFYQFTQFDSATIADANARLYALAERTDLCGLVIIGNEGINSTLAASAEVIVELKELVKSLPGCQEILFKDSQAHQQPFRRFKIKVRDEIVTLQAPDILPDGECGHLSPAEWNEVIEQEDVVILDTRNTYETRVGKFSGALDPGLDMFSEFKEYVGRSGIPKDKKVLMYCTGGIRCEKAALEMRRQGYSHVFQLQGGILNYLAEYPNKKFEGECFVFDHRVAVDQNLAPSKQFDLCPHCGDPGDKKISCKVCSHEQIVCEDCLAKDPSNATCSKNCAHHYRRGSNARRKQTTQGVQAKKYSVE